MSAEVNKLSHCVWENKYLWGNSTIVIARNFVGRR